MRQPDQTSVSDQSGMRGGSARVGFDPPDRVQGPLELEECASGGDDEGNAPDDGGEDARASLAGSLEQALDGERALAANS